MGSMFHPRPKSQQYQGVKSKPSLFDDDDPAVRGSRAPEARVISSRKIPKDEQPGPEHHAAARRLLKRRTVIDPDTITDPKLRAAYVDQLGDETNGVLTEEQLAGISAGKRNAQGDRELRPGDLGRGAKKVVTGAASAGKAGGGAVNNGAGFLLGILAYGLAAAYLQGGTPLARQWLAAKFLNHAGDTAANNASQGRPSGPDTAAQGAANGTALQAWLAAGGDPSSGAFGSPSQNAPSYANGITSTYTSQVPGGHQ